MGASGNSDWITIHTDHGMLILSRADIESYECSTPFPQPNELCRWQCPEVEEVDSESDEQESEDEADGEQEDGDDDSSKENDKKQSNMISGFITGNVTIKPAGETAEETDDTRDEPTRKLSAVEQFQQLFPKLIPLLPKAKA